MESGTGWILAPKTGIQGTEPLTWEVSGVLRGSGAPVAIQAHAVLGGDLEGGVLETGFRPRQRWGTGELQRRKAGLTFVGCLSWKILEET